MEEKKAKSDEMIEAKMDDSTHIIQNIVFARDPKIFDTKNGQVVQKDAFMHENMLDIKALIRQNEERSGAKEFGMRQYSPRKIPKTKE